jgi:hypothetical protein
MNAPWFPPYEIDWQDALNPLANEGFREQVNPFVYRALQQPTMQDLRIAPGMRLALYCAPDDAYVNLGSGATYDGTISLLPESWLIGISATSAQPEGFLFQLTLPTGNTLFTQPVKSADISNARPFYLSTPQGLPDGGPVKLRLVNQSAIANSSQIVIWVIEPEGI